MSDPKGIDVDSVSRWLAAEVPGALPPFQFDLITAGGSNLTFRVSGADATAFALRRPAALAELKREQRR